MKAGTIIELPDGRRGTIVFHGLIGYGIRWGEIELTQEEIDAIMGSCPLFGGADGKALEPEAILRDPNIPLSDQFVALVGTDYTIIKEPTP